MIKEVIRLVRPGLFLPMFALEELRDDAVLIRPSYLSICAADQRYFQGNRPPEVLAKKLPLSLFHEAVGEVLHDPSGELKPGTSCVLLPGGSTGVEKKSNYATGAFFRSSNADGFCQEVLCMEKSELIPLSGEPVWIYVLTELMSVCCQALSRLKEVAKPASDASFGVWGDGSMGYMMARTLSAIMPDADITIFGKHDEKLLNFSFCTRRVNIQDKRDTTRVSYGFECVGGNGAQHAIHHAVDHLHPTGCLVLMGVSEIPPVFPTRLVLEKGLTILGTSRSVRGDFEQAKQLIDREDVRNSLLKIVSSRVSFQTASELGDIFIRDKNLPYKTILKKIF